MIKGRKQILNICSSAHLQSHLAVVPELYERGDHNGGQNGNDHPGQLLLGHKVVEQGETPVVYLCDTTKNIPSLGVNKAKFRV